MQLPTEGPFWWAIIALLIGGIAFLWYIGNGGTTGKGASKPVTLPWATKRTIGHLLTKGPEVGRIAIARLGRWVVSTLPEHSLLVVGGARSWKTTSILAPALRAWNGPAAVLSTKPDLMNLSLADRQDAMLFCPRPTDLTPEEIPAGVRVVGWSPLDAISEALRHNAPRGQWNNQEGWTAALRTAAAMTAGAKTGGVEQGDFWKDSARDLLAPLLLAAAAAPEVGVKGCMRWVTDQDRTEPLAIIKSLALSDIAAQQLETLEDEDERILKSIYATLRTALDAYKWDAVLNGAEAAVRFRPSDLTDPERPKRTLYLLASSLQQKELAPIFMGILDELIQAKYRTADQAMLNRDPSQSGPVVPLNEHLLLMLDEAANIFPYPNLPNVASEGGSHGVVLALAYQDLSQLRARIGQDGTNTVIANCQARIITRGMGDVATLDVFQNLIGSHKVKQTSHTRGQGGASSTTSIATEQVLQSNAIRTMKPGTGVVVYGPELPVFVKLHDRDAWRTTPRQPQPARSVSLDKPAHGAVSTAKHPSEPPTDTAPVAAWTPPAPTPVPIDRR